MNNIFKIKWNAATQSYMVCSELARRAGKATVGTGIVVTALMTSSIVYAGEIEWKGDQSISRAVYGSALENGAITILAPANPVTSNADVALLPVLGNETQYTFKDNFVINGGARNFTAFGSRDERSTFIFENDFTYTDGGAANGGSPILIEASRGSTLEMRGTTSLTGRYNYTGGNSSGGAEMYGVIAGSSVNTGNDITNNGKYATAKFNNLNIKLTDIGTRTYTNPVLINGLRAIQGAHNSNNGQGSAGYIEVTGKAKIDLEGNRAIGIYVSGNPTYHGNDENGAGQRGTLTPVVILNDTDITLSQNNVGASTSWDSHGIKIGKVRGTGTGGGIVHSKGELNIDTTNAKSDGGIKILRNSSIKADYDNSSTNIKTNGYALQLGGKDDFYVTQTMSFFGIPIPVAYASPMAASEGTQALFKDAVFSTTGTSKDPIEGTNAIERKDLIFVDQAQENATISFSGDKTNLTTHQNGYIINVSNAYTVTNQEDTPPGVLEMYGVDGNKITDPANFKASSVTFKATDKGSMIGLVTKDSVKADEGQVAIAGKSSTLNIELDNGFTWKLRENENSEKKATFNELTLSNQAVLDAVVAKTNGASDFTATGNVISNTGIINLANDRFNDVLTIEGNYEGKNGAVLKVNTDWNSPGDDVEGTDSTSDLLVITGNASGSTIVQAIKADGSENVIDGDIGSIAADLYKNSAVVVRVKGTDSGVEGDLVGPTYKTRSSFTGEARTTGAGLLKLTSRVNANNETEYFWTISQTNSTNSPTYDPVVPAYVLAPQANLELGYTTLATLHERRGENQTLAWDDCGNCGEKARGQSWGLIFGKHLELNGKTRLGAKHNIYGFQLGHDFAIQRTEEGGHRLSGGYVSYGTMNSTYRDRFDDEAQTGKSKQKGWNLGLTHTRYAPNGAYVDLVGQIGFLNNNYHARNGVEAKQKGTALALSVEVGRPYALREHKTNEGVWLIEPQAQLMYQMLKLKDFKDDIKHIKGGSHHGLRGRLGVRLAYNTQAAEDKYRTNTFYVIANLLQDFSKGKGVQIGQDKVKETFAKTWAEVGLGGQLPVGKQSYVYADARYERSLSGAKREGYRGTVGFKYTWK